MKSNLYFILGVLSAGIWPLLGLGQSNISVSGFGYFKNRSLDARLSFLLDLDPDYPVALATPILEDSAFLLLEQVKREGYLKPVIKGYFKEGTGEEVFQWNGDYSIQLEVGFTADEARYQIVPGILYHYESVFVAGVEAIPADRVERFFIPGGALFQRKKARVFTYENWDRRKGRLLRALDEEGYRSAKIVDNDLKIDDETGAVQIQLEVVEGLLYRVGKVNVVVEEGAEKSENFHFEEGVLLTRGWEQEQRQQLRNYFYNQGYPDTTVSMEVTGERIEGNVLFSDIRFVVNPGNYVQLAEIEYRGDEATKRSVLDRQINLKSGVPLNPIEINEARRKLMGLGIYEEVGVDFEAVNPTSRKVIYTLNENERKELKLLAGWGSYELARAGFHWEHRNPWGHAHRYEMEVKQSFKATEADATYSIPQIFGTQATSYFNTGYQFREELSFDRSSYGFAVGMSTLLGSSGIRLAVEYGYSRETADRDPGSVFLSEEKAIVSGLSVSASLDLRDDVFAPTSGYHLFAETKGSSKLMGGNVDFLKMELGGSYHFALTESTIVHLGLKGGTIFVSGGAHEDIPFNERFFSGGENTVRGYQEGGASPLDTSGAEVGAETYLLGNLEIEQRLLMQFSIVLFWDGVVNARDGFYEGGEEILYSVGLGLRYNTIVGPLRLEYGFNPDPRTNDADGTLHFSIGFPF